MNLNHNKVSKKFPLVYEQILLQQMDIDSAAEHVLYHYGISVTIETHKDRFKYYIQVSDRAKLRIQPFLSKGSYAYKEEAKEKGTLAVFVIIENLLPFI